MAVAVWRSPSRAAEDRNMRCIRIAREHMTVAGALLRAEDRNSAWEDSITKWARVAVALWGDRESQRLRRQAVRPRAMWRSPSGGDRGSQLRP